MRVPGIHSGPYRLYLAAGAYLALGMVAASTGGEPTCRGERAVEVTATAYNSLPEQTDSEPAIAAWGDLLEPGMRAIAISRDLEKLGLERGAQVCIEGLHGHFEVLDRMHRRWQRRIDIYMGEDLEAAIEWGRRDVTIRWLDS